MFGYVRPLRGELKVADEQRYRAAYCGLCRQLGKDYGWISRFYVNYDMTFLYFLLAQTETETAKTKCYCPANPLCPKQAYVSSGPLAFVAAVDVILCYHKLMDDLNDNHWYATMHLRLLAGLTRRSYRKAAAALPDFDALAKRELARQSKLEREGCGSVDEAADPFARLLAGCARYYTDSALTRPLEQLLYHVGRFVYLVDALDDLPKDVQQNRYNPLRYRFSLEGDKLSSEDMSYFRALINGSINLAGAALELLPGRFARPIVENMIYLGLPAALKGVENGDFTPKLHGQRTQRSKR